MNINALPLLLSPLVVCACGSTGNEEDTPANLMTGETSTTHTVEAGSPTSSDECTYAKPGYATSVVEGRLWVFEEGSEGHAEFQKTGEPAKSVTLIGQGPDGMTLRGDDKATMFNYMFSKAGYHTELAKVADRDVLWVFAEGSESLEEFLRTGEPAKSVTLIGRGPGGMTLRGDDKATMLNYMFSRAGYHTELAKVADRDVLWVFAEGSESLEEFLRTGEPAKSVTLIGQGPGGMTLRGADRDVLKAYASH